MDKPAYLEGMERAAEQVLWKLLAEINEDDTTIKVNINEGESK